MRWVLDSNVWIEAAAGVADASRTLLHAGTVEWCGFSSMSRLEVLGFPKLTSTDEARLEQLLAQFHEIPVSAEVIATAIRLRRQVRIKAPDAIVAATAIIQGADLITRNVSDFQNLPDLRVVSPAELYPGKA